MYLAFTNSQGVISYQIRQTYLDEESGNYLFRQIFDLGPDPAQYIHQLDEHISWFDDELESAVAAYAEQDSEKVLEELLWEYLPLEQRKLLERFRGRESIVNKPLTAADRIEINRQVHMFDRKRLYFLRYGAIDQGKLFKMHEKLCRPLLDQSRDEREFYFITAEEVLSPSEYKQYIFAIFNLQRHFTAPYAAFMPEALPPEEIEIQFVEDLCKLNQDKTFWAGMESGHPLHDHLIRYLIMFFDYGYGYGNSGFDEYIRKFMDDHRSFSWPDRKPSVTTGEASEAFATSWDELTKLDENGLTKLFRKRAKELHPDTGGEHDKFIQLLDAYNDLLLTKKSRE